MSIEERDRLHVMRQIIKKTLNYREAAEQPGAGVRHVKRLVQVGRHRGGVAPGDPGIAVHKFKRL